ncbi:hypothetical protein GCM10009525_63090 [Streptosporangium amethystogenes subsp. fukuiense]
MSPGCPGRFPLPGEPWSQPEDSGYRRRPTFLAAPHRRDVPMYKEFAIEAIVWLIPVVILVGLAYMITRPV